MLVRKLRTPPQMRLDSCCWSSLAKKHAINSKQVLLAFSHENPGNHWRQQELIESRTRQSSEFLGNRNVAGLSTLAHRDDAHVQLSPKPQRPHPPPAPTPEFHRPPLSARPQRPENNQSNQTPVAPRLPPLRERLQIARRKRFEDDNRKPGAPPPSSNFGSIVSDRLSSSAAAGSTTGKQEDTFSPLVKAIFDLLDQPLPSRKEPELPLPRVDFRKEQDEYFHHQRHRYRVYQQAFNTGDARFDSLGRTLCRILRHQATQLGLPIRSNGYVKLDDILSLSISTHAGIAMNAHTVEEVLDVVERDPKQRYSTLVEEGKIFIRANQGHSMKAVISEHLLTEITSPEQVPVCVHGTFKCFLSSIMRSGLNRMSRNHVHFAIGLPNEEGVISGMMDTVEVLIYLNVAKALEDGMRLYISDNKVLLTEGFRGIIPRDYFEKVVEWPSFDVIDC